MTNVYSLDGILVFGLLFVCTCAYFKKVPRLKTWLLSEKKGVWGVFYKGKVLSGHREKIAIFERCGSVHEKGCCDWNPAACCCCNCLHYNGLLRPVHQMNSKVPSLSTANQGDKDEEVVGNLDPV
ncbi:protein kish-B isoform X2 [Meriones unguiculatus]|uniref:protein kish-B isoform X2 n=1 Tax=Meriones unguiculatus TaxID=10047 RepID=UPI000B4F9ADD|nr:protein kish-B isoform X2 [Meriones unguiculatus]